MRRVVTVLLTAVLGSSLFMPMAAARDSGKVGFGRHGNYYGAASRRQPTHDLGKSWRGVGYHAYHPDCASSIGEASKVPPWSFC
jgi:hypothetical protein